MRQRRHFERAKKDKHRTNNDITAPELRVIGLEGEQLGVITRDEALRMAEEAGVDLVEVAGDADPPVCRLLDYGKLKYKEQKKAAESRKRGSQPNVKELRIRYRTDTHDLETKVRKARKFLEGGDRVRFQMRFRGREIVYQDLGKATFEKVAEMLEDLAEIEETSAQGNRMLMTLVPK